MFNPFRNILLAPISSLLIAIGVFIVVSCSISYKFNGASIDYTKTKTITISDFPIRAALVYAPLANRFNEEIKDLYTRQTKLGFVSSGGDMQLDGEITGYSLSPQAIRDNALASMTRLTVTVRVRFVNLADERKNFDRSFSAFRDFDAKLMLDSVQDALIKEIVAELVDLIFNATAADW